MAIKRTYHIDEELEVPLTFTQVLTGISAEHHYNSEDDGDYALPRASRDGDDDSTNGSCDQDEGPQRDLSPLHVNPQDCYESHHNINPHSPNGAPILLHLLDWWG
ncbi:hypothetical protein SeLEV6574_g04563 [Synchytrium endobioticum]|uniref:Uncharacterized protein n=1 Tax=Synchytrium endobioticum TaxID=286115 RepID=A0A507CZ32_9FUNG|nr:hypothetical protein SeLEV6574_g04563 [Synchytrium endobioticum]